MKNFQLIAVVLIAFLFTTNKAVAQCGTDPITIDQTLIDITLDAATYGYCPGSNDDVDPNDSGHPIFGEWIVSGDDTDPDCDPLTATFLDPTYVDNFLGGCPEMIEREWTVTYDDANGMGITFTQIITLEDNDPPVIDSEAPDIDVLISSACDETDDGVAAETGLPFSDTEMEVNVSEYTGTFTEDCTISFNGNEDIITYIDTYTPEGCPSNVGVIERLWTITDLCGNSATDVQIITLMDMEAPQITTCPADITVELVGSCDENDDNVLAVTGFVYSPSQTLVAEADFEGIAGGQAADLCDENEILVYYTDSAPTVMEDNCPNAFISFTRTWTLEDACGNQSTDVCEQLIELFDNMDPVIDAELPDFDDAVMLNACDENDPNIQTETGFSFSGSTTVVDVSEFTAQGGAVSDNCNPLWETELEISYSDVFTPIANNCPDEVGQLVRTWVVTDHCGNTTSDEQTILIFDTQGPTIIDCPGGGVAIQIDVLFPDPCDDTNPDIETESGFPFSAGPTTIDGADFPGVAEDNCNGGEILEASYFDEVLGQDCETGANIGFDILRHWTVTDLCGNTAECSQSIQLMDNEEPMFPTFPDFFYDQGPQGPGSGVWEVESIFCDAEVDFTSTFNLPGMAEFFDNCTQFTDLLVGFTPDISSGPVALVEGDNVFMVVITDQCNNRFTEEFVINMTCTGCGPDQVFETCDEPPTICDLNDIVGFNSCTPEYLGSVIESLCDGFVVNNPSYFEFIAGAEDVDLTVLPSACLNGGGVQAAIIDPCIPTSCYTDLGGACFTTETTVTATGLTVGNVYQLIVDGCGGDECNWEITAISATAFNIPDPSGEEPIAELPAFTSCDTEDLTFCEGSSIEFWPENFEDALYFFCWSIDNTSGVTAINGNEDCTENTALETLGEDFQCSENFSSCGPLELMFEDVGSYTLCLTELENGCDNQAPDQYCWEIQIVANGPIPFGTHKVCQNELEAGWFPDVLGPNGEEWEGNLINFVGDFSAMVSDECGCEFEQQITVELLPVVPSVVEVAMCIYELEEFYDAGLDLEWDDIEDFYDEPLNGTPNAFLDPLEQGSLQEGYNGIACDTFIQFDFFLFDVPGEVIQVPGPACDVVLSLELDLSLFPVDLIDPDDLIYNWYDSDGLFGTDPSVSVTESGGYDLIVEYFLDDGSNCTFEWEFDVNNFGNPPSAPTFVASPNETCITELDGIVYSVPPAAAATYIWVVTNGTFTPNATNDEISISITDPALPTTVCVSANSICGDSPPACEDILVTPAPIVEFMPVQDICVGQVVNIASTIVAGTADEYFWSIPDGNFTQTGSNMASNLDVSWSTPGTYNVELSVEDVSGCQSNVTMVEVNVLSPLDPPTAACTLTTSNSVEITITDGANAPDGFTFNVVTGQAFTEDNGVVTVTGLTPGDNVEITLTTLGGAHPCGDQIGIPITCIATDCPLNPALETPDAICLDGSETPFLLEETAGNPGGIWDGPGTDPATGMFDPAAAGPGTHTITYSVEDLAADCTASANMNIVVFPSPIEDFALSIDTICLDEVMTIAFDDSDDKTYTWDFDVDNSNPVVDDTDFALSYSSVGNKTITMTVTTGLGCEMTVSHDVFVRPEAVFPEVFCTGLSPVSVGFEWDEITGVEEYEYEILINGQVDETGTTSNTEITVDGLEEGDMVDVNLIGLDLNGCLNPVQTSLCVAQDCPTIDVEIQTTEDELVLCFDPLNPPVIQLSQTTTIAGVDAVGTGEWVGADADVLDPATGEFTPTATGMYVLSYVFAEDGTACPGNNSITYNLLESPDSEFTQDFEEICITDVVTFTLVSAYDPDIFYDWTSTFDDAAYDLVDNGDGTFTVQFFEEGAGEFSLQTIVAGCESPVTTVSVEVGQVPDLPTIDCQEDLGYILFEWDAVDCVEEYIIFIDGVEVQSQTETEYELTNLDPNQTVDIEIEIVSNCLCDFPATISASCTAQDCEAATITFDGSVATEYCMSSLPVFTYTADVDGVNIDDSGTFTWSGDGVDADGNVDFSGFSAGTYTIDVEYEENDCLYTNSINIEILANPSIVVSTVNAPCPGALGEVMVNGEGNEPFEIVGEGGELENGLNALQTGEYDIVITDANGCTSEANFVIGTDAEPGDELVGPATINADSTGVFNYSADVPEIENIVWTVNGEIIDDLDCLTSDCEQFSYTSTAGGEYEVCAFAYYDGADCELVECRSFVSNELTFSSIYIPNVITPDNDEDPINKALTMFVHGQSVVINSVGIYDRWGNRVHFNEEEFVINAGESGVLWDGRFEGKEYGEGVYVYLIDTEIDGIQEWMTDDITIVR